MKRFAFPLLCASIICAEPAPRPYQVEHYFAILRPDLEKKELRGEVDIRFRAAVERLDSIELDAGGNLKILSIDENGADQRFDRQPKTVIVKLSESALKGKDRTLKIKYLARPSNGLVFFPNQVFAPYNASDWMICNFRPENRATIRTAIHTPGDFKVVANGEFAVVRLEAGLRVTEWEQKTPAPPFVFGFAAGDFAETFIKADGTTLRFLLPESLGNARKILEAETTAIHAFLTEASGMRYPGSTYTTVLTAGRPEQELAGFTFLPEAYGVQLAEKPDDLWLLAHEFAHQWYAIGIACQNWSDFWLNEGIGTFLADAFLERRFGRKRYDTEIERVHTIYDEIKKAGKDRPLSFHDWTLPSQASGRLVYDKGAWVLHLLRKEIGEDAFWNGLRTYTKTNWGKAVVSRDLQTAMETSAHRGLEPFFKTWVYN